MAEHKLLLLPPRLQYCLVVFFFFLFSPASASASASATSPASAIDLDNRPNFFSFDLKQYHFDNITSLVAFHGGARLTNPNSNSNSTITLVPSGLVLCRNAIKFPSASPAFSTYFSFSLSPPANANASSAFAFFLTLSSLSLMDLLPAPPPSVISLTFMIRLDNLEIRVRGLGRIKGRRELIAFRSAQKLHSWIDYSATASRLELRLAASKCRPQSPILSCPMAMDHLSIVLSRESMLVGFAFTAPADNRVVLYDWSFAARRGGGAPYPMHSEPLDPSRLSAPPAPAHQNPDPSARVMRHPWALLLALIFAAACGAMLAFFALFVWFSVCAHRPVAPVEYPVHPPPQVIYQKIVLAALKDAPAPNTNHK